jgi:hypothetical protein
MNITRKNMTANKNIKIKSLSPKTFLKENIYDNIKDLPNIKKKIKVKEDEFEIPEYDEYTKILKLNFNVRQLKSICRFYKQKVTGNKQQLIFRLYNYLKYSYFAIKIQKYVRGHLFRVFLKIHGPAIKHRKCINEKDFLTFQNVVDIPYQQFYSYKDKDNFIYGFDICTLYNMLKSNEYKKNPYNRNDLPVNIYKNIKKIIKMAKKLKIQLNIKLQTNDKNLSSQKKIELRAIEVFQKIDNMGYITDSNWITRLPRSRCIRYLRELDDVWNYRAQISNETKSKICPNGTLFQGVNISMISSTKSDIFIKNTILNIIEKIITAGVDEESRSLGCMYALGTITIVSPSAASSLPWLYDSFMINQQ